MGLEVRLRLLEEPLGITAEFPLGEERPDPQRGEQEDRNSPEPPGTAVRFAHNLHDK